jgi:hypothetical protein
MRFPFSFDEGKERTSSRRGRRTPNNPMFFGVSAVERHLKQTMSKNPMTNFDGKNPVFSAVVGDANSLSVYGMNIALSLTSGGIVYLSRIGRHCELKFFNPGKSRHALSADWTPKGADISPQPEFTRRVSLRLRRFLFLATQFGGPSGKSGGDGFVRNSKKIFCAFFLLMLRFNKRRYFGRVRRRPLGANQRFGHSLCFRRLS